MKLIVGLGNPGKSYANNRHNVGFRCIDYFARLNGIPWTKRQRWAKLGVGDVAEKRVVLAKPRTYMNLSGQAVIPLVRRFNVPLEDLVVICDDLDLPLGRVRLRRRGGSAGHKGMESISDSLGSQDFPRIRVGIGRPDGDEISYVLSDFNAGEREVVKEAVAKVAEALHCILTEGIEAAMNRYN